MICIDNLKQASNSWAEKEPFPHFVVDDFFELKIAETLEAEFPSFDDTIWYEYGNAIEVKKACNNWNAFPETTYKVLSYLNSDNFINLLSENLFEKISLYADPGLNGGGWHIHKKGGKLNTHLDY